MNHVVIAGGCGFVGSNLAISIIENIKDVRVSVFDSLFRRGSENNINRLREAGIAFIYGDARNSFDVQKLVDFDVMIDCAADPSVVSGSDGRFMPLVENNLATTLNLAQQCVSERASMIFLSTNRVYPYDILNGLEVCQSDTRWEFNYRLADIPGVSSNGVAENFPTSGFKTFYGATKLCSEEFLRELTGTSSFKVIVNRCGVVCGPWQMGKIDQGVMALWVAAHLKNQKLSYFGFDGMGKQSRDFLHVYDLSRLVLQQVSELLPENVVNTPPYRLFNVGGGIRNVASLHELTLLCREASGHSPEIVSRSDISRKGDLVAYATDNTAVSKEYNWRPRLSVRDAVNDTTEWMRAHPEILKEFF